MGRVVEQGDVGRQFPRSGANNLCPLIGGTNQILYAGVQSMPR
jgi:hypothetical protein